ncbi:glycine zipper 2TM domain-containing protein [Denitromonas sp. IR12]|uniref:Glycine zipper 2TM domain-containing protein n=2 Tax=Denitromonas iodatirespirans TaxID=2795389 RepID=A0A944HDV1_DENI1|nr:glycine zipper 2TM domain-containing protein [Denitromonas iodatirespirans]MBT0962336.1 glycine zipper 2TM domain-containing protein [Denitromonas iodatirespirans]
MVMNWIQRNARALLLASVALIGVSGCASNLTGDTYSRAEARRAMVVKFGTVQSVRYVKLEGTKTPIGTVAGGAIGGIAGSTIGRGKGSAVGAVLGAVAGGLAGSAVEEGVTRSQGVEVTVRMDDGRYLAVVQEDAGEGFRTGERVRIVQDGGTMRVSR